MTRLLILLLGLLPAAASPVQPCDADTRFVDLINRSIESCVSQEWTAAFSLLDSLVEQHPDEPGPLFYRATVHSYRMTDEESFRWEGAFLADLDSAGNCIERLRATGSAGPPSDSELDYLEGSILAWRAYHSGRRSSWVAALQHGLAAASRLEGLHERCPDWADLKLGIGNLRYWKSVRLQRFNWLPFFHDQRADGIRMTLEAREEGMFSPLLASANLCWMQLEEGDWELTRDLCRLVLQDHPGSRLFLFPLAESLLLGQQYAGADSVYKVLLEGLESDDWHHPANRFICLEKRSGIAEMEGRFVDAIRLGEEALAVDLPLENRQQLDERFTRLDARLSRCRRVLSRR